MKSRPKIFVGLLLLIVGVSSYFYFQTPQSLSAILDQVSDLQLALPFESPATISSRTVMDTQKVEEFKLNRLSESQGLKDLNSTDQYVEEQAAADAGVTLQSGQISYYQAFVTPGDSAVVALASGQSENNLYQQALKWVWVEDQILNGQTEKWLSPHYFLTQTSSLPTNPVPGQIASDCESQAYTLVSALRASGVSADKVRVVTGQVDFNGTTGGHAWVELLDTSTNSWFQLEPSSGNYYDSDQKAYITSSGLPFDYFKTHQYPVLEIWTYFNDQYFWDNNRQSGNAPDQWLTTDAQFRQVDSQAVTYDIPDNLEQLRPRRVFPDPTLPPSPTATPSGMFKQVRQFFQHQLNPPATPAPSATDQITSSATDSGQISPQLPPFNHQPSQTRSNRQSRR